MWDVPWKRCCRKRDPTSVPFNQKINRKFGEELADVRVPSMPAGPGNSVVRMNYKEKLERGLPKEQQTRYCSGVGMLLYLVKFSRPDISNSVQDLSKYMDCANKAHYKALIQALKYVLTSSDLGIKYSLGVMINFNGVWKIVAYYNSYFAGDKNIRTSVTGFCIYIGNNLILWKARSQKSVTLSSTEAEYVAISKVCA